MTAPIGHTDCDGPMTFQVHRSDSPDVRFPIIDDGISVHERRMGPTSITRQAEVNIPITGFGQSDWLQYIDAFQEGGSIQTASVLGAPIDTDGNRAGEPVPIFTGYIAAVGSTSGTNRARVRVYDPMKFLDTIVAGTKFSEAHVEDVLNYIIERFRNEQSVFESVDTKFANANRRVIESGIEIDANLQLLRELLGAETNYEIFAKGFSSNRDTLATISDWLTSRVPVKVWFGPSTDSNGITLYAAENIGVEYNLTPESTSLPRVIENGALYEIKPHNEILLKGKTGQDIEFGETNVRVPTPYADGNYPEATATYPPLVDRYGEELVRTETSNLSGAENLEDEAKARLIESLSTVTGGTITTTLAPQLRCFDRLEATPACAGVSADVDPLTYEVQRLTHTVRPNDNDLPRTEVGVGLAVDPDKITTESTVKDVQTGGEPTDNDPLNGLSWSVRSS